MKHHVKGYWRAPKEGQLPTIFVPGHMSKNPTHKK